MKSNGLSMPFPLRVDFTAQVVIPVDLTQLEADRLSAFLKTLAKPEEGDRANPPSTA